MFPRLRYVWNGTRVAGSKKHLLLSSTFEIEDESFGFVLLMRMCRTCFYCKCELFLSLQTFTTLETITNATSAKQWLLDSAKEVRMDSM